MLDMPNTRKLLSSDVLPCLLCCTPSKITAAEKPLFELCGSLLHDETLSCKRCPVSHHQVFPESCLYSFECKVLLWQPAHQQQLEAMSSTAAGR